MELLRPEDRERLLNLRNSSNPPSTKPNTMDSRGAPLYAEPLAGLSALSRAVPPHFQQQQEALVSWRGIQTSSQAFKPFEKNPSKQARYELYLNSLKQGDKGRRVRPPPFAAGGLSPESNLDPICVSDALEQSLDPGMTEWERSREREEFVRASILYRPTSSSLSSRFTRAKHQEDDDTVEVSRDQEVGQRSGL